MHQATRFIAIALLWAAGFWGINILLGSGTGSPIGGLLIGLGGISPTVAALYLVFRQGDAAVRADFFRRIWDPRPLRGAWLALILGIPVGLLWAAIGLARWLGDAQASFQVQGGFSENWLALLPFALFVLFFGPVPEEIGWRGYLLDALRQRHQAWRASLIIAAVWGLWHVPLFFIAGYPLQEMRGDAGALVLYFALLFPKSVFYTWIYLHTQRSILAAILLHFAINFSGMLWETTVLADGLLLLLYTALAAFCSTQRQTLF
jgi:membrane protease YdiL (CAAX protease family)